MTPRERWLAVLNHERPDRIPVDYRATPETTANLLRHLGLADEQQLRHRLHFDPILDVRPDYVGPPLAPNTDVYGIEYTDYDYGTGAYRESVCLRGDVPYPLAAYNTPEEVEANYRWPSPDWYDYSGIAKQIESKEDCIIRGGGSEPFPIYKDLRGVQQAYLDLATNPDLVHYCLDKLFELCYLSIQGSDGRYILGPCHNLQPVGPPENIVIMYDTAYEHGRL